MTKIPALFTRYEFRQGDLIPEDLDLRGAIGFSQDKENKTLLHRLILLAQKWHNFIHGRQYNESTMHSLVVLKRARDLGVKKAYSQNDLLTGDIVKIGAKTVVWNYLAGKMETGVVFYVPKDLKLKEAIAQRIEQTCFNPKNQKNGITRENTHALSYFEMIRSLFTRQVLGKTPEEQQMQRTALAVADLIKGSPFHDQKNRTRAFYCTGYILMTLQACLLRKTLTQAEIEALSQKDRKTIASDLFQRIQAPNDPSKEEDPLRAAYRAHKICWLNPRRHTSAHVSAMLHLASEPRLAYPQRQRSARRQQEPLAVRIYLIKPRKGYELTKQGVSPSKRAKMSAQQELL